jgi:hypothetical protein
MERTIVEIRQAKKATRMFLSVFNETLTAKKHRQR